MAAVRMRRVLVPEPGTGEVERMRAYDLPDPMARQLRPEVAREFIPPNPTNYASPPYAGEPREEKGQLISGPVLKGSPEIVICTLQRPWPLVGFAVFPGNLPAGGAPNVVLVRLYALVKGVRGLVSETPIGGGPAAAFISQFLAATAELAVFVPAAIVPASVTGIRAALWGSTLFR